MEEEAISFVKTTGLEMFSLFINRELNQTMMAMTMRTSQNKRFNEQSNACACKGLFTWRWGTPGR